MTRQISGEGEKSEVPGVESQLGRLIQDRGSEGSSDTTKATQLSTGTIDILDCEMGKCQGVGVGTTGEGGQRIHSPAQ